MGLYPEEYRDFVQRDSISSMQYAADKLQWAIVKGLDGIDGVKLSIVNSMYIGSYPRRYKRLKIPTFNFSHSENAESDVNVGFCNLAGYKFLSRYITAKRKVCEWAESTTTKQKVLLVYALTTPFCQIADYVKKHYKNVKVCLVVPDLPEYMNTSQKKNFRSKLKALEIKLLKRATREIDCFVFLADAMKEWFSRPVYYTVVEGIATNNIQTSELIYKKKNTILYAGGIKREYGIVELAEAFIDTKRLDWELVIYGNGSAMDELKALSKKHSNIIVKGSCPNSEVIMAQREASILVNPRKNQQFTKYSFPSKILEYMSSGTPMLAYKLDGIPSEYDDYYFAIPETPNGLFDALEYVMNMPEDRREEMGRRAKMFITENKNQRVQCEKIVALISATSLDD